jgi:hypothetical protein
LGTNSPNQEATLAQSYSGFLENPPVIQWHETNDALVNTKKCARQYINCTSRLPDVQSKAKFPLFFGIKKYPQTEPLNFQLPFWNHVAQ